MLAVAIMPNASHRRVMADDVPVAFVGRRGPDADPAHVHALEVMTAAERRKIRQVVAPAPGAVVDVMRMVRGLAAPRHRAEALVALENSCATCSAPLARAPRPR